MAAHLIESVHVIGPNSFHQLIQSTLVFRVTCVKAAVVYAFLWTSCPSLTFLFLDGAVGTGQVGKTTSSMSMLWAVTTAEPSCSPPKWPLEQNHIAWVFVLLQWQEGGFIKLLLRVNNELGFVLQWFQVKSFTHRCMYLNVCKWMFLFACFFVIEVLEKWKSTPSHQ